MKSVVETFVSPDGEGAVECARGVEAQPVSARAAATMTMRAAMMLKAVGLGICSA